MKKYSKKWWIKWVEAAGIRTIKTIAETAIGTIGASKLINEVDWKVVLYASLLSGVLTILSCLNGLPELDGE
jgi:ABC-type lipoprotein release transport system permease subunit